MDTKFKTIWVPLGHGRKTEVYYFDSLREAMDDDRTECDEIYEVANAGTEYERTVLTMYRTGTKKDSEQWDILSS
jgi:hypothetical protein